MKIALQNSTIRKAVTLDLIVGTVLNLINQGNFAASNQLTNVSVVKLCSTYLTPFMISVCSTTTARLGRDITVLKKSNHKKTRWGGRSSSGI